MPSHPAFCRLKSKNRGAAAATPRYSVCIKCRFFADYFQKHPALGTHKKPSDYPAGSFQHLPYYRIYLILIELQHRPVAGIVQPGGLALQCLKPE